MAINLWYDYTFGHEICNNLLSETERHEYLTAHKTGVVPVQTKLRYNAILPNVLRLAKIEHNVIPSVAIRHLYSHNWASIQYFPVEMKWWNGEAIELNFSDSHFLSHGKERTEILFYFPTETLNTNDCPLFEEVHKRCPNNKIRFIHGNLKTPLWVKNKSYLTYKSFDYFWFNEQRYTKPTLDINREETATFSFYNNRFKLHRAIPYYRLFQTSMLNNSDSSFNGIIRNVNNNKKLDLERTLEGNKRTDELYLNNNADYNFYYYDKTFIDWCTNNLSYENKLFNDTQIHEEQLNTLAYLDVVAETHAEDAPDNLFITEKTYRPIARGCIFLILGYKGTLEYLKSKGIETFSDLFDETYDNTTHWFSRWKIIEKNIKLWLELGPNGRKQYYKKNFDKLVHNQHILYSRDFKIEIEGMFR